MFNEEHSHEAVFRALLRSCSDLFGEQIWKPKNRQSM